MSCKNHCGPPRKVVVGHDEERCSFRIDIRFLQSYKNVYWIALDTSKTSEQKTTVKATYVLQSRHNCDMSMSLRHFESAAES